MILSLLLFSILLILLLRNYTKGVSLIFVLSTFISHFSLLGQTVYTYISFIAFILFFINNSMHTTLQWRKTPTFVPLVLVVASLVLCNYFAESRHTLTMVSIIVSHVIMVFIMYVTYKKKPQTVIHTVLRTSLIYGFIVGAYALVETVTRSNPYIDIVNSLGTYTHDVFVQEIRFGLKRSQSIFSMHTTSGAVCTILFGVLLVAKRMKYLQSKFTTITIILLFFACMATGSRAVILGMVISLFMFFRGKYMMPKYWIPIIVATLVGVFVFGSYIDSIVNSFIHTERIGGSNTDMRERQLEISLYYWGKSFWVGNGIFFTYDYALKQYRELFGAESLWFPTMIDQGAFGMFAYASFFVASFYYCIKRKCFRLCYFVLGLFASNTLSSLPNVDVTYSIFYVVIMIDMFKSSRLAMKSCNSYSQLPNYAFKH